MQFTGGIGANGPASRPQRVCFLFIAQPHQLWHAFGIALEMSCSPAYRVDVLAATTEHIALARELAARHGGGPIRYRRVGGIWLDALRRACGTSVPPKVATLLAALPALSHYDAIVVPERTSLLLRRLGLHRPSFIHTCHGAGDRAVGLDPRIRQFDLVLLAGDKQRRRMLEAGLLHDDGHVVVGYGKFDLVAQGSPASLFRDARPIVLYNPHCSRSLSSWWSMGESLVRQFAADARFNLIVAPHVKLLDGNRRMQQQFRGLLAGVDSRNILFDPGSRRSMDMTYTRAADVYIGDVSSQVYEFISRPRPCIFLDPNRTAWRGDENFRHWRFGPVLDSVDGIVPAVDAARQTHDRFRSAQVEGLRDTFDITGEQASVRAVRAIAEHLERRRAALPRRQPRYRVSVNSPSANRRPFTSASTR